MKHSYFYEQQNDEENVMLIMKTIIGTILNQKSKIRCKPVSTKTFIE